jgi:phosphate/sulfate permease
MGLNTLPWYAGLFIALVCATITICAVALVMVPRLKKDILGDLITGSSLPVTAFGGSGGAGGGGGGSGGMISLSNIKATTTDDRTGGATSAAYDNVTFKPDKEPESTGKKEAPPKPAREITLDPKQLTEQAGQTNDRDAADRTHSNGNNKKTTKTPPSGKPALAPKPIQLRRQAAQDQTTHMDEIDLGSGAGEKGGDIETGLSAAAMAPPMKPHYQSTHTPAGERHEVAKLFSSLQILTACFASFAHGTNDVSNAVAPLIPIWNIYATGTEDVSVQTQVWILAFGSIGICTGLWAWGRAVMNTIADGLTKITPSKGFSVELGAAISVLVATKMGLPISTTHCKVGSLVIVGYVSSNFLSQDNLLNRMQQQQQQQQHHITDGGRQELQIVSATEDSADSDSVDWKLFANIAITWVSTLPMAAAASAMVMYLIKWFVF